jgi:hypothetical protein
MADAASHRRSRKRARTLEELRRPLFVHRRVAADAGLRNFYVPSLGAVHHLEEPRVVEEAILHQLRGARSRESLRVGSTDAGRLDGEARRALRKGAVALRKRHGWQRSRVGAAGARTDLMRAAAIGAQFGLTRTVKFPSGSPVFLAKANWTRKALGSGGGSGTLALALRFSRLPWCFTVAARKNTRRASAG